jgi:cell division inhibitor SulA/protein ImuA
VPYAPALAAAGLALKRLLVARTQAADDAWWAAEQALRSGACGTVLAWLRAPDERRMRRLQLAAETGRAWGVLFRPGCAAQERSPAALRLRLVPAASGLAVYVLKRRGGPVNKPVRVDFPRIASAHPATPSTPPPAHPGEAARDPWAS